MSQGLVSGTFNMRPRSAIRSGWRRPAITRLMMKVRMLVTAYNQASGQPQSPERIMGRSGTTTMTSSKVTITRNVTGFFLSAMVPSSVIIVTHRFQYKPIILRFRPSHLPERAGPRPVISLMRPRPLPDTLGETSNLCYILKGHPHAQRIDRPLRLPYRRRGSRLRFYPARGRAQTLPRQRHRLRSRPGPDRRPCGDA